MRGNAVRMRESGTRHRNRWARQGELGQTGELRWIKWAGTNRGRPGHRRQGPDRRGKTEADGEKLRQMV